MDGQTERAYQTSCDVSDLRANDHYMTIILQ